MPNPGRLLSHYRLVEKIGAGGMGVVWRAEDTILNRTVAIKVLPADLVLDEERRQLFLNEARLAASVSHGNIVQVYELGRESGLDFIAMEFVPGQPLNRLLAGKPLRPDKVAEIGVQVAEGLARAHRKGLIHRDLKPANILVTPDGDVKIVDFGLATLFSRVDTTAGDVGTLTVEGAAETHRAVAGTLPYMSPEQVRGERLDARSDIFAFGAVMYEMTTGRRPFASPAVASLVQEILKDQPTPVHEFLPSVPLDLQRIIEKALAKRREERYQTVDDIVVDLHRLLKEIQSGSAQSQAGRNTARSPSRRPTRRIWIVVAALVACVATFASWAVVRSGREVSSAPAPADVATGRDRGEIAVLPFENLSPEGPYAYFAGGLHGELLTQLTKVAALKVISRTSVMGYQGTSLPPLKQIANELGVGSVVEGSVQVVGGRLRVNVQLIDASTDEHLWAEHYDRTLDDAFTIQSEVAQQIVSAVGALLTNAEQERLTTAPTANAEAYQMYLQGREYHARPGFLRQNAEIAQQLFEQALKLDPDFALAHAALSEVHGIMYWWRYDPSVARAMRQREEAEVALRLAPDLPQAHLALGTTYYWVERDYRRSLAEFTIALEGLPNDVSLWMRIGAVHRRMGNWNEASAVFDKALQLDPRNLDVLADLGAQTYHFLRRYADVVRICDQALSLAPDYHPARVQKGWAYVLWHGQLDTLRTALDHLPEDTELGFLGNVAAQRAALLLLERNADGLLEELHLQRGDVFDAQDYFLPCALYAAWAQRMRGDPAAAQAAFASACVLADSALAELPDDWRVHAAHGLALAGAGRREEALREAAWLQDSPLGREDHFVGLLPDHRAMILAQSGETEAALEELERVLAGPSWVTSVHTLGLDPRWDPIRDHPRFKVLLAKYGSQQVQ